MRNFLRTTAKSARAKRPLTLLGVLALIAAVGGVAYAATKPDTTAPVITFLRPLDGASYNAASWASNCANHPGMCGNTADPSGVASNVVSLRQQSTGKWWNGSSFSATSEQFKTVDGFTSWRYAIPALPPDGAYLVHARATDKLGNTTAPAAQVTIAFTIDTHAPAAPQIVAAPASPSPSKSATFTFASEAGATFLCKLDGAAYAACASTTTFSSLGDGQHTVAVEAKDAAGNVGPATSRTWVVDTKAPPKPTLTQKPANPSSLADATFGFTDTEAGVAFQCRVDGAAYAGCTSPTAYHGLSAATHHFDVRALDAAGNASAATGYDWKVTTQTGLPFSVSGNLSGLLAPGLSGALHLTISNPNSDPILVTSLTVAVQSGSTKAGCDGPTNLQIVQSNASAANPLTVPAHGSTSLPSGGVSAPQVQMKNLPVSQDACKGATFTFAYGGSAHS
ncbi:MAG TPA: hypothetical protein VE972_00115 [Conexibacter sp.]|nr:hypothetical protein [Conexibacter sp.]